jgi:anhydro-N-acetylmuramic acid kinase
MKRFLRLSNKSRRNVIGILSGTSIDAVDIVLTRMQGSGKNTKIKVLDFQSDPINKKTRNYILNCSNNDSKIEDICLVNSIIGNLFADSVLKIIKKNKLRNKDIDLIGSHGQTIFHLPGKIRFNNHKFSSTLQTGDPSIIAVKTGIITAGDFRSSDVAAGGEGAPLVPYLDYILFSHPKKNRLLLNIGGISNITYLKKNCKKKEVIAFDCGPGNMLIDSLSKIFFNKNFDKNGSIAKKGRINDELFNYLKKNDKFYRRKYPKSTGREYYGDAYIKMILSFKDIKPSDIIRTVTEFTSFCIYHNYRTFIGDKSPDELIVSGGGSNNPVIIESLKEYFKGTEVKGLNDSGINSSNKEAVLFAFLANELVNGNKTNIKTVTGASEEVYLGKICLA